MRSEASRLAVINLERKRAKIVSRKNGVDRTAEILPELKAAITPRGSRLGTEDIAQRSGLGKVYDTVYRSASLEVHARMFGLSPMGDKDEAAIASALPAVISLLRAILLLVDARLSGSGTSAQQILCLLNIDKRAGR